MTINHITQLDRKILAAVQLDNLQTAERLSEQIGLSPSAIRRRMLRLRRIKAIVADVAVVDPNIVGQTASFIVEVSMERESAATVAEFKRQMRAAREVQQCYHVTGDADFVLIIVARDLQHYETLVEQLFSSNGNVRRIQTGVILSRVKTTLSVPIG